MAGLVVAISLTQSITALADNTEDLFNVYGLTLGGPIQSEVEKAMAEAESEINAKLNKQRRTEIQNQIVEQYLEQREEELNSIISDVSIYQKQNEELAEDISTNILTADISTLLTDDTTYKANTVSMNELLSRMNDYTANYSIEDTDVDLQSAQDRLATAKELYIESLDAYDLGDVSNIQWILPNTKKINSSYGYRVNPINTSYISFHAGVDYSASTGTEVSALFNGDVISCGWSDAAGNFITVQCGDNVKYFICHLSEILVETGQHVNQYDVIALTGDTGYDCTGPHLHLALYLNGVSYDVDELFE